MTAPSTIIVTISPPEPGERYSGTLVDVALDAPDGSRREQWSFREDGAVNSYAKAHRVRPSDEWTYTLLVFPDSPPLFELMWKDPPQEVLDRVAIEVVRLRGDAYT